jgi:glycosyltransferase involved in cell wall biosynthesis
VKHSTRPIHIGYLVQQFPPEVGAGPARVTEMALRWQDAGARVTVFTGMPNRPEGRIHAPYRGKLFVRENWQGMEVLRSWLYASPKHGFARTILNNLSFMITSGLHALSWGQKPDVLVASSPPFFPHITGSLLSRKWRIPLVLEIRDLWPDYLVGMGILRDRFSPAALFALERWLLRAASRVVVVTESFRARVAAKGVRPDRIEVIPNGVDTSTYYRSDEPPPLRELVRRNGEWIVGYLGNFGAGQGLDAVIEAAAILRRHGDKIRFVLAGDGTLGRQLSARAEGEGLDNLSVHPPIPKEQTRAFYNGCDICLVPLAAFPILQETVPSKLFEIMACETPVIASLGGEGACIVRDSRSGLVAPPGDGRAMAAAVESMMAMPESVRREMGTSGRCYVDARYGRSSLAARYLELLSDVVGGSQAEAGSRK